MPGESPTDDDPPDDTSEDVSTADEQATNPVRKTSERIVQTVADVTDTEPIERPPLYDAVNPDAVDDLFPGDGSRNCRTAFEYASLHVSIDSNSCIEVKPVESADD